MDKVKDVQRAMWSRRRFIQSIGGAALGAASGTSLAGILAACATGTTPSGSASPRRGGHVTEVWGTAFATFNPYQFTSATDQIASGLLFDGLVSTDTSGTLVPMLAKALPKTSADGMTYTFQLRPGIKWSDGQALTGADVVFSYRLLLDPAYKDFQSRYRGTVTTYVNSVTSPDPLTVVFNLKQTYAPFLARMCQYCVLPAHVLSAVSAKDLNTSDFFQHPNVASGTFTFVSQQKGQSLVLQRNPTYYRGPALLDKYAMLFTNTSAGMVDPVRTGEADITNITPSFYSSVKADPGLNTIVLDFPLYYMFAFNLDPSHPTAKIFDKPTRKALLYALDRESIVKSVLFNLAKVPDSVLPTISWAYNPNVAKYAFDQAKAKQMLDAAGWTQGSDGIRTRSGSRLEFVVTVNDATDRVAAVQAAAAMWKQVGANVTLRVVDGAEWTSVWRFKRTFDVQLYIGVLDQDPDQSDTWASQNVVQGGNNAEHYSNPAVDKVLADGLATVDQAKRKPLYGEMQSILADDLPMAPLAVNQFIWVTTKRVQNFKVGPFSMFLQRPWFKDVFVTDGK